MDLGCKARTTIAKYSMLAKGDKVLVAVSGGPDSVCLLDVLYHFKQEMNLTLVVAHYHHQMRGKDADKDQELVEDLAKKYLLEFVAGQAEPGWWKKLKGSNEELARNMRYEFLESTAEKFKAQKIALGHNAGDQAESFFINLLRGAGMLGLAGMPPVRDRIIRPLIEISREEILDYLRGHSLPYRIDRTNQDTSILRNRIRTDLTPLLKTYNPEIIATISRTGEVLREDEQFMQDASRKAFAKLGKIEPGRIIFSVEKFRSQPKSIQRRLIRHAIERLKTDLRKIEAVHIFDLERMLDSGTASFELDLPGSIRIVKSYDLLAVESMSIKKEAGFKPVIVQAPCQTKISVSSDFEIEFTAEPADFAGFQKSLGNKIKRESIFSSGEDDDWIALDKTEGGLELRPPKPGDRIIPLGMNGHRKLKDIFVELKVPREQRKFYPVISDSSGLLWVPGFGISEKNKVKPESAQIVLLKIKLVKRSGA